MLLDRVHHPRQLAGQIIGTRGRNLFLVAWDNGRVSRHHRVELGKRAYSKPAFSL